MEFPFAHEGDLSAWIYTLKYRIDQSKFRARSPMTRVSTPLGTGYLVAGEDAEPIGSGLVEWYRIVASVPRSRTVPGGQTSLTVQKLITTTEVDTGAKFYSIDEYSFQRAATVTWEYSLRPIRQLYAPRVIVSGTGVNYYTVGGWGSFRANQNVLSQDSEHSLYMGKIYCRKTTRCVFGVNFSGGS